MTRIARMTALALTAAALSGCVTSMITEKAAPPHAGAIQQEKHGIHEATAARINDEGFLIVCVVGEVRGKDDTAYSLVLETGNSGLASARISRDEANPEALPEYSLALDEVGEACKSPPAGTAVNLRALDIPKPTEYEYTPIANTRLRNRLAVFEKPPGLTVVTVKRSLYCSEVIIWNPAAESRDNEFVRVSTPMDEWTVTGSPALFLLVPITFVIDIAILPLQPVLFAYMYIKYYETAHMVHC